MTKRQRQKNSRYQKLVRKLIYNGNEFRIESKNYGKRRKNRSTPNYETSQR